MADQPASTSPEEKGVPDSDKAELDRANADQGAWLKPASPERSFQKTALQATPMSSGPAATSLQRLLDPGQALLGRKAPLQDTQVSGLNLPAWSGLQTSALELGEPAPQPQPEERTEAGPASSEALPSGEAAAGGGATSGENPIQIPADTVLQPTLDESVVEALIQALYDALPAELDQPERQNVPETTISGTPLGRHRTATSALPTQLIRHAATDRPPTDTAPTEPGDTDPGDTEPAPKQFSRGAVDEATLRVTREALSGLQLDSPSDDKTPTLQARTVLGAGEACFLRARSALWAWRTHRQNNLYLHANGPASIGRDALIEQRIGPVTLLIGCRVTELTDTERSWGFTLVSLSGQVVRSRETFLVDWQDDDQVMFYCASLQHIASPSLIFLAPVHSALRRMTMQGYTRNMIEMSADAD